MNCPENINNIEHISTDMRENTLTQNQQKAIRAMLEANSIEKAAKKVKVSRGTIYNWLKQEAFKNRLEDGRKEIIIDQRSRRPFKDKRGISTFSYKKKNNTRLQRRAPRRL